MRGNFYHMLIIYPSLALGLFDCRQAYAPPEITSPNRYLVVDGFINLSPNSITTFNLNRTRNLGDSTVGGIPELNARMAIVGSGSDSFPLADRIRNGIYTSDPITLDPTQQYRLTITTGDGQQFSSDPVPCELTPPIDSVFWRQPSDLNIYISTHDPSGSTHYYRYDYNETWEHDSQLEAIYGVANNMMFAVDSFTQKHRCWTTDISAAVLLTTSSALTHDVIDSFKLVTIPGGDPRVTKVYSMLVRQYAITKDAYDYWQLIEKTTQNVGTLFDLQPTQLTGNIHCTTDPATTHLYFRIFTSKLDPQSTGLWLRHGFYRIQFCRPFRIQLPGHKLRTLLFRRRGPGARFKNLPGLYPAWRLDHPPTVHARLTQMKK
jgi:hypothetical protein